MPLFNTGDFSASASTSALRLSPVPDVLSLTVNVSPTAGVPEICTRQPLTSIFPPVVYVKLPAPLIEYVFALRNSIVTDERNCASALSSTSPAEIEPVPVLPLSPAVRIGAAAATSEGSVISTLMSAIAPAVGRIRKVSPTSRRTAEVDLEAIDHERIGRSARAGHRHRPPVRESRNAQPPPVISRT